MNERTYKSYADWILKSAGICFGFIYSVGFLVVARHLARYGVSTFSLFQTQYLVAGIWTISPPIAFALVQRTGERMKDSAYSAGTFSFLRRFLIASALTGVPFGLLLAVSAVLLGGDEGFSWSLAARLWACYLLLVSPADLAWLSWRTSDGTSRWWLNRHVVPYYLTVFALGVFLYALLFAGWFYPMIPASFGGGKPLRIVLIPSRDGLPIGIAKGDLSGRSIPYELLAVTDKSYVVISPAPSEESIEIDRDAVQGMVVLKDVQILKH